MTMNAYLQHGEAGGPYLTESTDVREVAAPRSGQTVTGYGRKMPTPYQVRMHGRWRRVYCVNYGNSGSLYIGDINRQPTFVTLDHTTTLEQDGLAAQRAGVKWWNNPHPSGSIEAGRWDAGHTLSRKQS